MLKLNKMVRENNRSRRQCLRDARDRGGHRVHGCHEKEMDRNVGEQTAEVKVVEDKTRSGSVFNVRS
jgi:hypothetical protein